MKPKYQAKKLSRLSLLLMVVFFVAVVLCAVASQNFEISTAEAASATFSLTGQKFFDSTKGLNNYTNPDSLLYTSMSSPTSTSHVQITSPSSNTYQIATTKGVHYEYGYADLIASGVVPAWYKYEIKYTFSFTITFTRSNDASDNSAKFEFFDFASDTIKGSNAGLKFGTGATSAESPVSTTTPSTYLKLSKVQQPAVSNSKLADYTVTYTYVNNSNNPMNFQQNFGMFAGCRATTADEKKFTAKTVASSVVTATKLSVTPPTADTHKYVYSGGSDITYKPNGFDADKMELTADSDALTQTDAGSYTIKIAPKTVWDDGTTDALEFPFVIAKADPTLTVKYVGALPDPLYVASSLPSITTSDGDTAGTLAWDIGQKPNPSISEYTWTFTPNDTKNYNVVTGTKTLNYVTASVDHLRVALKPSVGDVYDRYNTKTIKTFSDYIKSIISVYIVYEDGSESDPIPNANYSVDVTETAFLVSAGKDSETKTISVRYTADDDAKNKKGTLDVTVNKADILEMDIYPIEEKLTYPVTLDEIKANYDVYLTWNFDTKSSIPPNADFISVSVKDGADIHIGTNVIIITYSSNGLTYNSDEINCEIEKGTYDTSAVSLESKSVQFNGSKQTIAVAGNVKDAKTGNVVSGVTVTYSYKKDGIEVSTDGVSAVGIYDVIATFTNPDSQNYNDIVNTLTATLTITNSGWDMTGVTFAGNTVTYDGNSYTLEISGDLPDSNITVTYTVTGQTDTSFKNAGTYEFTASFSNPDPANYADIPDMHATLTINKATFDMSGVSFEDNTVTADGETSYTLEISGDLPDGVTVSYTVADQSAISFTEAGTYEFTASFGNPDPVNYENIADMTATLTVQGDGNEIITNPEPKPNNGDGFIDKIKAFFNNLIEKHFPLWQIATMAVAGILTIIFLIKAIQYGNRRKKAKGEAKKISAKAYSALLPIFSTDIVLAGLSNQIWSIMTFAMLGLALLMFFIALITRRGWKKAELAKATAVEDREERKHREAKEEREAEKEADRRERREIKELREQIALMSSQQQSTVQSADSMAIIEEMRREMEAQRRQDEERHRQEMDAMKMMLAGFMGGRAQGDNDMPLYGSIDDTELLVQRVIAGLLPTVQQMIPEQTAYLSAPAYEQSASDIEAIADRVAEKLGANQPSFDQSDEIKALTAEMKDIKKQLAKGSKEDGSVSVDEIVQKVTAQITPSSTTVIQGASAEEVKALNAQIAQMQQKIDSMAFMSADEYDDDDFDDEEEWDSILDEDEEDNFVESVVIEEDGTVRKISPNFRMRLKESSDKNREWYAVVKNMFCSQRGVTYRVCKRVEKIRYQGQVIGVIGVAKRSIKLWLALKPYEYDARRYHHKDVSDKPRFVDVPMYVRVGSDRALERAQELILALFQEFNMEARKRYNDRDIQELIFTLKHNKLLTNKYNKTLLRETVHVHDCDVLDDETAEKCIETKNVDFIDDSVIETVKLDDIDAHFLDGNRVTLDRLKKVGLVSEECTGYNVIVNKRLTKPLIIVADDFTLPAVKMIVLTGGRAIKLAQSGK